MKNEEDDQESGFESVCEPMIYIEATLHPVDPPIVIKKYPKNGVRNVPRGDFVTHLESAIDGTRFEPNRVLTMHEGRPLWVRYDLAAVKNAVKPSDLIGRVNSMWRYRELLPLPSGAEPVTFGEGMTPLLPCPRLGKELGLSRLFIKDESQLPTGSFKSRGMAAAVSMAKHLGLKRLAVPTAGNAGGALAAYGARAGMEITIFMPDDTPIVNQLEAAHWGAYVFLVYGLIIECCRIFR
jgi:threonine synthase